MKVVNILEDVELIKQETEIFGYCFGMDVPDKQEIDLEEKNKTKDAHFGVTIDDKLQAAMIVVDFPMTYFSETIPMGGIGGVTTYPESRENNFIKKLFEHSFQYMKEKGYIFSALAPFNYQFYRKFGYDVGFTKKEIKVDINDLNHIESEGYKSKPMTEADLSDLVDLYTKTYGKLNGAKQRDESWFKDKLSKRKDKVYLYGFYKDGKLEGYLFYKIEQGKEIRVFEMSSLNVDVRKYMLVFLYKHRAQVKHIVFVTSDKDPLMHLLLNQRQEIKLRSGMMVRVMDVQKILERYSYQGTDDFTLTLRVIDKYIPDNTGVFVVTRKNNEITVSKNDDASINFEVEIPALSQLLFGYTDLETLDNVGRVITSDDLSPYYSYFKQCETIMLEFF